ncbi:MAG: amylo-alpha-1,6-glucosidase [Vicinamibacteria bacterium]
MGDYGRPDDRRRFVERAHELGLATDVFDADAPFTPRGCIAQAWSVSEVLRCWVAASGAQGAGTERDGNIFLAGIFFRRLLESDADLHRRFVRKPLARALLDSTLDQNLERSWRSCWDGL